MSRPRFTLAEWKILALLAAVQFAHIVDFMIIMPLGPQLMRLMGIKPSEFSLLVSSYTFCAGATGLLSAFVLDHFDRKRSLIVCFVGFGVGTLACALADSFSTLLLARCLTGAFGGILGSQVFAIVGDAISPQLRGAATGVVMGSFSLASIFGVPFSLYLASQGSWHSPLYALAILSVFICVLLIAWLPAQKGHLESKSSPWAFLRTVPFLYRPRMAIGLMVCIVLGQFSIIPFLSPSLVANTGLPEAQLPLLYLFGGAASMLSSPWIGRLCDQHGPMPVLLWGASISMIPVLMITNMPPVPVWIAVSATTLFFTSMGGRIVPTMTLVTGSVLPKNRGAFMSLVTAMQQFAAAVGSTIAGYIVERDEVGRLIHYSWVGGLCVFLTLVALVLAYKLRHEPPQVAA